MCAIRHYDVILAHKNENVLLIKKFGRSKYLYRAFKKFNLCISYKRFHNLVFFL